MQRSIFLALLSLTTPLAAFVAPSTLLRGAVSSRATSAPLMQAPQMPERRMKKRKEPKAKVKEPSQAKAMAQQLVTEQDFYEGAPDISETFVPGLSVFTVVGIIPFGASLARQAWTKYRITNKRFEVKSGFQGKETVQLTWAEVVDVKWLRRGFTGGCGDMVLTLRDGAKVECRSLSQFDRNLKFIMDQLGEDVAADCFYPDGPAREYLEKVASGEEPPPTLENALAAREAAAEPASA